MRIVVTNDDGIDAPGLHALAAALHGDGHDVVVVAPSQDHSGFSAALGPLHITGEIAYERVALAALPGVEAVSVDGPPALCVLAACMEGFGPRPDLVASGINAGANLGAAVLHSGTVGAGFTANNFRVPAVAVSVELGADSVDWTVAAEVGASVVAWAASARPVLTLNVNVPDRRSPRGAQVASLERGGEVQTALVESGSGRLRLQGTPSVPPPGSDAAVLAAGFVAITPLRHVQVAEVGVDAAIAAAHATLGRRSSSVA